MIIERERTNGGDTTGSIDTTLNSPPTKTFILRYTSTYAKRRPTTVEMIPTTKPIFSVLVIALMNVGILNMRLNTEIPNTPSPTNESTSRIARG